MTSWIVMVGGLAGCRYRSEALGVFGGMMDVVLKAGGYSSMVLLSPCGHAGPVDG